MSELLWLKPTTTGVLPPTSLFFSTGRFVLSTFILGTLDASKREAAYRKIVEILLKRVRTHSLGDVKVKHSRLSREFIGSAFPAYSKPKPPDNLFLDISFTDILADEEYLNGELAKGDKLKLVFQAVFGGEHMLSDITSAWRNFTGEWDSLEQTNDEPLAERISPEGDLYRINLRPAKELGISPKVLFEATTRSAILISGDLKRRKEKILPQSRLLGIESYKVDTETSHHSVPYTARNHPAYRLVHVSEIAELLRLKS